MGMEVSSHDYEEVETINNCKVQILKCKNCGEISIGWERGNNMSDYISKSKLLNKIANVHYDTENPLQSYSSIISLVNNMETEERKTGYWTVDLNMGDMECSECHTLHMYYKGANEDQVYCSQCGARMEETIFINGEEENGID